MDMSGEYRIPAPRQAVWEALNDPEMLKQSITGCESLERVGDNQFTASVVAKVGPVKAKFGGKVTLSDLDPPNGYTISGEGAGGAAGFAKGGAQVNLYDADDGGTILRYAAKADVGGKLAQIGSRLIQGTAKKMADDFFAKFGTLVAARSGVAPVSVEPVSVEPVPVAPMAAASITAAEASSGIPAAPPIPAAATPAPHEPLAPPQAIPVPPVQPTAPVPPSSVASAATARQPAPSQPASTYRPAPPAPPAPARPSGNRTVWIVVAVIVLLLLIWVIS